MLLLIIFVAALWMGWRVNMANRQREAIAQVKKYNGFMSFDYEFANGKWTPRAEPKGLAWFRRNVGEDYFREAFRVTYIDQPPSDATLAPLADLNRIQELLFLTRIHHTLPAVAPPPGMDQLTEAGLLRLEGLTNLRRIEFEAVEHAGSLLPHFSKSVRLEELKVSEGDFTEINDDMLPNFGAMPRLRTLSLWCKHVNGACLKPLRGSKSLESLEFFGSKLSEASFEHIGTMTNLKALHLYQVEVSDANLSNLRSLASLRSLHLGCRRSKITGAGLANLSSMVRLESLDLTGCKITRSGLASLKEMKHLKALYLGWTDIDDGDLAIISSFPQLEDLELYQTKITNAGLVHLRKLKTLKRLNVLFTAVTKQARRELEADLPTFGAELK